MGHFDMAQITRNTATIDYQAEKLILELIATHKRQTNLYFRIADCPECANCLEVPVHFE